MSDFRRRNLILLASAALVSILLAVLALHQRTQQGAPHYTPTEFLPGFAANVKNVASIHVAAKGGAFDVTYTPEHGWVLPDRGNFPADFDAVRHMLIGLATLETIAPRTARADWLHYLNLDAPPQGGGVAFTVKDAQGATLATLITGNVEELGDPNGTQGLFVRRPGENQTYLARAVFVPQGDIASWLMSRMLTISPVRLKEVAVTPPTGPAYAVARDRPAEQIYKLSTPVPKGKTPDAPAVNSIPYSLTTFSYLDVRPATVLDFAKAAHVVARTFDGLVVSFDLIAQGDAIWARFTASAAPDATPAIAEEAAAINTRTGGWAFQLPGVKGRALTADLSSLMMKPQPPRQMPQGSIQF